MKLNGDGGSCDADGEEWDDVATLEKLDLSEYDMKDFHLNNVSDTYDRRDGVSDARTFRQMRRLMLVMGFSPEDVFSILRVVLALLHASNLAFRLRGAGGLLRPGRKQRAPETRHQFAWHHNGGFEFGPVLSRDHHWHRRRRGQEAVQVRAVMSAGQEGG